jgi:hypothetical protein
MKANDKCLGRAVAMAWLMVAAPAAVQACDFALSDFSSDGDKWQVADLPYPNPDNPPAPIAFYTPSFEGDTGNPAGDIVMSDPSANAWYWYAPRKFLKNKKAAYGGSLQFDLSVTGSGTYFAEEDVILVSKGMTIVAALATPPVLAFTHYSVPLSTPSWKVGSLTGAVATAKEIQKVLKGLTDLYIRGEHRLQLDDFGRLDNVLITRPGACVL